MLSSPVRPHIRNNPESRPGYGESRSGYVTKVPFASLGVLNGTLVA
ncbi:hypothetical protein BC739_001848 [Kutzneria viridogrisea]|uniref:Uncharacterized protein n=1 Tax=Kutzneria viridogrisea TaxID=47990 RepID=A0ABR6BD52_9PSEU|nr:hypothetical protein [Kutzneria viridogrisea]